MKIILTTLAFLLYFGLSFSQEENKEEFVPSGAPQATIFANFHGNIDDTNNDNEFEIQRVYFGYEYNMSEIFTGKVNFDIGNPNDDGNLERTAYVKEASLSFRKGSWSGSVGLIGLRQFKVAENIWGLRYVYKTIQDEKKFGSSADAGVFLAYKIHDMVSIDATMINGEGHKRLQSDNTYKNAFGLTLRPIKNLTVRGYYDIYPRAATQSTISTLVAYQVRGKYAVGVEYCMLSNYENVDGADLTGLSAFGSYDINEKWQVFGRYDSFEDTVATEQLIIGGIQYSPINKVKLAANYQGTIIGSTSISYAYINLLVKI